MGMSAPRTRDGDRGHGRSVRPEEAVGKRKGRFPHQTFMLLVGRGRPIEREGAAKWSVSQITVGLGLRMQEQTEPGGVAGVEALEAATLQLFVKWTTKPQAEDSAGAPLEA